MDLAELMLRTESIRSATTSDELARLTSDLAVPAGRGSGVAAVRSGRSVSVSVFGDISRSGSWRAQERLMPIAVFGDVDLDFRQAAMVPDEVTVTSVAPFGDVEVIVPNGVRVDVSGFTLFGSKKIAVQASAASESAPVVRVRAFTVFGSVKVWSA